MPARLSRFVFFAFLSAVVPVIIFSGVSLAFALDNIRVATASMTSPSVLYLLVAQREGYYKSEGLNVELINMRGEISVKIATAGEIDFFTQGGSALTAAVRGIPVKVLMIVDDKPGWDFIAQPNIRSIAQLKGGTVGIISFEGSVAVATREILRKNSLDPAKDVNLLVMGGNDVRYVALKGKAIQATLLDPANSYRAIKEGFVKLASASDYVTYYLGGAIGTSQDQIKQAPEKIGKFVEASLKGYYFYTTRREPSINYMMQFLRTRDRDAATAIYDANLRVMSLDGMPDEKILHSLIEEAKKIAGVKKEFRAADLFDFSFVRKANERLKANAWRP
ncbi:MAG: ABC transporter substrate-binding protein [Deltaproteobacteria bacterium]|nr:ABC transporter substrate-binding protein [Deltaproteobacteria bacterium]